MEQEAQVNWLEAETDTEVKVKGERGAFRFKGVNPKDGSLYLWGGVTGRERNRSVAPEKVELPKKRRVG